MFKKIFSFLFLMSLVGLFAVLSAVAGIYYYYSRDLPDYNSIRDYQPFLASQIYAANGERVGDFFEERRYLVNIEQVPDHVKQAFMAAEDAGFYTHPGIDPLSILRALIKNLQTGSVKQGGSTITQQVVKNLLLTKERSLERKVKEAILAYRIESKLTKDDIIGLYLNQIFFGNTAHGIQAAARAYFKKNVEDITIAEAAMLAGLPKAPSRYSPVSNYKKAKSRQRYVLNQMQRANFITTAQAKEARDEEVKVYRANSQPFEQAHYYMSEIRRLMERDWPQYSLNVDGLQIQTALDLSAYNLAEQAVRRGLREVDKRRGWAGPSDQGLDLLQFNEKYEQFIFSEDQVNRAMTFPALVQDVNVRANQINVYINKDYPAVQIDLSKASWANKFIDEKDRTTWGKAIQKINVADVVEVAIEAESQINTDENSEFETANERNLQLDQRPTLEAALTLVDPHTGLVPAIIGGFDYRESVFNRATQALRQPGSAFKPIIYLAAVDGHGYNANTIVNDNPRSFRVGDEYWSPSNYDHKFMGPITLRVALEKSRNIISAVITSNIGVNSVVQYAKKLGITSRMGKNLSISLGSSEVHPLELTRSYGVFPASGLLYDSIFITQIKDRHGKIIYDYRLDMLKKTKRVIPESSAFIMSNMMKGVVTDGTATRVKALNRPAAGKTGTSNNLMDAWFVGFTPEWVCGVWVGFDQKRAIGVKETGGVVSAPIWLYFMQPFLEQRDQALLALANQAAQAEAKVYQIDYLQPTKLEPEDFKVPLNVDAAWINKHTGKVAASGGPGVVLEYFPAGTKNAYAEVEAGEPTKIDYWDLVEG